MAEWLLYEHEDGRHAVALNAAAAALAFTASDPKWHRVGPVEVPVSAALMEAVDTLLETAPCDCSHKRRYGHGEHLSGCYLFDLNHARNGCKLCSTPGVPAVAPITSVAEFCAEGERLGLTAADLVEPLSKRPEFADCLPTAGVAPTQKGES